MRKLIGTIALMLVMQTVWAGNVNDVFNEFKKTEHADYVSVSPFLMKLGKLLVKHEDKEAYDIIRHINSVQVLDLEDCNAAVKQRFARSIALLDHDGYETMMRVNDAGEKVNILAKTKRGVIREMLIVCNGPEDCVLVRIKGKIKESDIDKLVEQHTGDDE